MDARIGNRKLYAILMGLVTIALIALATLPAIAQTSRPKPVVPEFTVRYVEQYNAPPTTVDPYTGETVIQHGGYQAVSKSIEVKITNQPAYDENYDEGGWYMVQYKGHFENDTQWKTYSSTDPGDLGYTYQQKGEFTIVSVKFDNFPVKGEIDFRIKSAIGGIEYIPHGMVYFDYYGFNGEESDWSNVQTVSIGENTAPSNPASTGLAPQNPIVPGGQPTLEVSIVFGVDWEKFAWLGAAALVVVLVVVVFAVWRISKSSIQVKAV